MRLRDKIHGVLNANQIPDEDYEISRQIAEAVSLSRAVGFKGTLRKQKAQHQQQAHKEKLRDG